MPKEKKAKEKKSSKSKKKSSSGSSGSDDVDANNKAKVLNYEGEGIKVLQLYDNSGAGSLSKAGFHMLIHDVNTRKGAMYYPETQIRPDSVISKVDRLNESTEFDSGQLFDRFDVDHSGRLSKEQFLLFFHTYDKQMLSYFNELSPSFDPYKRHAHNGNKKSSTRSQNSQDVPLDIFSFMDDAPMDESGNGKENTNSNSLTNSIDSVKDQFTAASRDRVRVVISYS